MVWALGDERQGGPGREDRQGGVWVPEGDWLGRGWEGRGELSRVVALQVASLPSAPQKLFLRCSL